MTRKPAKCGLCGAAMRLVDAAQAERNSQRDWRFVCRQHGIQLPRGASTQQSDISHYLNT